MFEFDDFVFDEVDIEEIMDFIETEKCMLFVGPLLGQPDGGSLIESTVKANKLAEHPKIHFHAKEQLFDFEDDDIKARVYMGLRKVLRKSEPLEVHRQIAQIPFDVAVSLSPDSALKKAYEQQVGDFTFQAYAANENPGDFDKPEKDNPLLYYLLGDADRLDSLIFSYDNLFEFIFSILDKHKLPRQLQMEIEEASHFIFLACDFDLWYMKLILRLFNLHKKRFGRFAYEGSKPTEEHTKEFYQKHFKLKFIKHNSAEFVSKLHEACEKKGILREVRSPDKRLKREIIRLIGQNRLEKAIASLSGFFGEKGNFDREMEVVQQSGAFNDLQEQLRAGTVSAENAKLTKARITQALLLITKTIGED